MHDQPLPLALLQYIGNPKHAGVLSVLVLVLQVKQVVGVGELPVGYDYSDPRRLT